MLVAAVVLAVVVAAVLYHVFSRPANTPPGPWGLPVVGILPWLEPVRKERSYLRWARQYGPVFSINELGRPTVVLSDAEMIRETFSRPTCTGRVPFGETIDELFYTNKGLILSNGETWQRARRFTLHNLRNLGMGRSKLEGVIQKQVTQFIDEILAPNVGKPIDLSETLKICIGNIIWGMMTSENFSIHDHKALLFMKEFDKVITENTTTFFLLVMLPWTSHLPERLTGLDRLRNMFDNVMNTFKPEVAKHRETVSMNDEPRDLIDAMLQEQAKDPEFYSEQHILRTILDLFLAGYDTTSTSLLWTFMLLAQHPEEQERMRAELQSVLGDRTPCLADRPHLPITEATIMEVQRVSDIAPTGVEHMTTETFQLAGYTIPRGARIVSLLSAVNQNPNYFEQPELFKPDRFLDDNGKLKPNKSFMPFSVGKRACLGESLARAEMFLFVTRVIQKYRLRLPDGFKHDYSVHENRIIRELTPFDLIAETVAE